MKHFVLILLLIITSDISNAQENKPVLLTVDRSIEIALENNLKIKISGDDVDLMKAKVKKAKSSYYPELSFRFIAPFVGRESGIFLDQLIWDFGRTPNLVKASKADLKSYVEQNNTVINDVILNTRVNYYKLLISKNYLDTADQKIKEFSKKYEQITNFVNLGRKSKLDLTKSRIDLSKAKLEKIDMEKQYELAREDFINTIGAKPGFNFSLKEDLSYNQSKLNLDNLIKSAISNRPELKNLLSKEVSKRAEFKAARQDNLPKIVGRTAYRFDGDGATGPDFIAGVGLDFPIFQGFSKVAEVEESAASLHRIQNEIELSKRDIILEVKKLYYDSLYAGQKMKVTSETLKSTNENLELTKELYNLGRVSEIDLLEAETLYSKSKSEYSESIYNYKIAVAMLEWATGEELMSRWTDNG